MTSMQRSTNMVTEAKGIKSTTSPGIDRDSMAIPTVWVKKVLASWLCAKLKAQRRRYEAVFEMQPSTNSIASIS